MNILKISFSGILLLILLLPTQAQTTKSNIKNSCVLDETIRYGVLNNGLTYYIKQLKEAGPGITMNFLVKVGSNNERSHEINFAHHVEHLAFRETKNFPIGIRGNEQLLKRLNMNIYDIGGVTGIEATQYTFITRGKEHWEAIDTGLLWFKDIAYGIDISEVNVDRERGVLLQEFRSDGIKAEKFATTGEMYSKLFPCFNNYYKDFPDNNSTFSYKDLQQFYKRWYQPENMAVVVAGNINNVENLELQIKEVFDELKSGDYPKGEQSIFVDCSKNITDHTSVRRASTINSEDSLNSMEMHLFFRDLEAFESNVGWKRTKRKIALDLITSILNARTKVTSQSLHQNFHTSISHTSLVEKPSNTLAILIETDLGNEEIALANTIKLLNQVKKYGITEAELEFAKNKILTDYPSSLDSQTNYWIKQIHDHFVYGEILPTGKISKITGWLAKLSTEEINKIVMQIISILPQDIGIILPAHGGTIFQSEEKIRNFISDEFSKNVLPFNPPREVTSLFTDQKKAALTVGNKIKAKKGQLGSRIFKLQNGLTLILKQVNSEKVNPLIALHGFSPQGASCFPETEYNSTMFAPHIIKNAGIGGFSKFDLDNFYNNTSSIKTGVIPYINYNESGFKAEIHKEELDKLLQLIHLYFTEPNTNKTSFENWKSEYLKNAIYLVSPANDLLGTLRVVTNDHSTLPEASLMVRASQQVEYDTSLRNYRKIFGDPANFTFILTGDFDEKEVLPLLQKYLGNIPFSGKLSCKKKNEKMDLKFGPGNYKFATSEFYNTENSFYGLGFVRKRTNEDPWKEELKVRVLGMILDNLVNELRDHEGLSLYHIGAGGKYNRILDRYEFIFNISCLPEELALIRNKIHILISNLKSGKISEEIFYNQRNLLGSVYSSNLINQPLYISKRIYYNYRYGEVLISASTMERFLLDLTSEDIVKTARKYLKTEYQYEVKME